MSKKKVIKRKRRLINWALASENLCGNRHNITAKYKGKKYRYQVDQLNAVEILLQDITLSDKDNE